MSGHFQDWKVAPVEHMESAASAISTTMYKSLVITHNIKVGFLLVLISSPIVGPSVCLSSPDKPGTYISVPMYVLSG